LLLFKLRKAETKTLSMIKRERHPLENRLKTAAKNLNKFFKEKLFKMMGSKSKILYNRDKLNAKKDLRML
jgi:hypothetical protein